MIYSYAETNEIQKRYF